VFEPSSHVCGFPALASKVVEIGSNSVNRTTNEIQPVRVHLERLKTCAARPGGPSHSRWSSQCEAVEGVCESQACVFLCERQGEKLCQGSPLQGALVPDAQLRHGHPAGVLEQGDAEAQQQSDAHVQRGSLGTEHTIMFRQLLAAKYNLLGKTLVVCSEMYTTLT
jgi:hypothetical protein